MYKTDREACVYSRSRHRRVVAGVSLNSNRINRWVDRTAHLSRALQSNNQSLFEAYRALKVNVAAPCGLGYGYKLLLF